MSRTAVIGSLQDSVHAKTSFLWSASLTRALSPLAGDLDHEAQREKVLSSRQGKAGEGADVMSLEKQVGATAKNLESKIQEIVGELASDQRERLEGKAEQTKAATHPGVEDAREAIKDVVDDPTDGQ